MLELTQVIAFRGVLQALVEKHFPAPDRTRIRRLLGLDSGKDKRNGQDDEPSGSVKRKPGKHESRTRPDTG